MLILEYQDDYIPMEILREMDFVFKQISDSEFYIYKDRYGEPGKFVSKEEFEEHYNRIRQMDTITRRLI